MDIKTLGIALDPQPFVEGERKVGESMNRLKKRSWETTEQVQQQGKKSKTSFEQMQNSAKSATQQISQGFANMTASVTRFSPALGGVLGMFGRLTGGITSLVAGFKSIGIAAGIAVAGIGLITAAVGSLLAVLLPIILAMKALRASFGAFSEGLVQAGRFQELTFMFAQLTGSMEEAEKRMESIRKLALTPPFGVEEFAQAGAALERMTGGLWSNEKALIAVGDAAVHSGQSVKETADMYGALFVALQNGERYEMQLKRMMEAGLMSPQTKKDIEAMIAARATVMQVWAVVENEMGKTAGAMDRLQTTYTGRVTAMKSQWEEFTRTLGQAIMPAATDAVKLVTDALIKLVAYVKTVQPEIQKIADTILALLRVMLQPGGFTVAMQAASDTFVQALDDGWTKVAGKILDWINTKFGLDIRGAFDTIRNADIWNVLETEIIPNIGAAFGRAIRTAIINAFADLGSFISGGLTDKVGTVMGDTIGAQSARSVGATPLIADFPSSPAANFSMGQRASNEDAARIARANRVGGTFSMGAPFLPEDGATGAALVDGMTRSADAMDTVSRAIWDTRMQSPAPVPVVIEGPDASLFGPDATANQMALDKLFAQQRSEMDAERKAERDTLTFTKTPYTFTDSAVKELPTKRAGEVKEDPMDAEARRITASLRTPAEEMQDTITQLTKLRDAGKLTMETFTRGTDKAKEDYESSVKAMADAQKAAVEAQMSQFQRLIGGWGDVKTQIDLMNVDLAQSISNNLTNAIVDLAQGTMSAKDAFRAMAASITQDILQMTTRMLVQLSLSKALGWTSGFFGTAHDGGVAGEQKTGRAVNPGVFVGAQRYHQGGMVGLQPGEVPIIAEKGEVITTEDQERMKDRLRGETRTAPQQISVTNVNVVDASLIDEHINKNPDALINVISRNKTRVKQILNISQ
jgi:hypothetical protein